MEPHPIFAGWDLKQSPGTSFCLLPYLWISKSWENGGTNMGMSCGSQIRGVETYVEFDPVESLFKTKTEHKINCSYSWRFVHDFISSTFRFGSHPFFQHYYWGSNSRSKESLHSDTFRPVLETMEPRQGVLPSGGGSWHMDKIYCRLCLMYII